MFAYVVTKYEEVQAILKLLQGRCYFIYDKNSKFNMAYQNRCFN